MGSDAERAGGGRRAAQRVIAHAALVGWLVLIAAGCDAITDYQRATLFQPQHATANEAALARVEGLERWWLEIDGGRVEAWYLPPLGDRTGPAPAVIFAHGNRELVEDWAEPLAPYREAGLAVLLPEYRGYGRSAGAPSEDAILEDFARFYDRLVDRRDIDASKIVFHGRSLGGGVMGGLSARRRAAALILESTFTSVPDLASQWSAPDFFVSDRFDTRSILMGSSTPTLVIHGLDDELVPFKHARELRRVAWDARIVAFRAGHNDIPRTRNGYWRHIREFLTGARVLP